MLRIRYIVFFVLVIWNHVFPKYFPNVLESWLTPIMVFGILPSIWHFQSNIWKAFQTTGTAHLTSKQVFSSLRESSFWGGNHPYIFPADSPYLWPWRHERRFFFWCDGWFVSWRSFIWRFWKEHTQKHKEVQQANYICNIRLDYGNSHFSLLLAWCLCHDWWEWVGWNHQMQCRMPVCCRSLLMYGKAWWLVLAKVGCVKAQTSSA